MKPSIEAPSLRDRRVARSTPIRLAVALSVFSAALACSAPEKPPEKPQPVILSSPRSVPPARPSGTNANLGTLPVTLELAADPASRGRGLSGRVAIAPNNGMLFAYATEADRTFWMKDCLIGLDIAFANPDGVIFQIESLEAPANAAEPASATSRGPARYVIEMAKGWFADHGLGVGSRLSLAPELAAGAARARP